MKIFAINNIIMKNVIQGKIVIAKKKNRNAFFIELFTSLYKIQTIKIK